MCEMKIHRRGKLFIKIIKVVLIKIFECTGGGLSDGVEDGIKLTTFVFDPGV